MAPTMEGLRQSQYMPGEKKKEDETGFNFLREEVDECRFFTMQISTPTVKLLSLLWENKKAPLPPPEVSFIRPKLAGALKNSQAVLFLWKTIYIDDDNDYSIAVPYKLTQYATILSMPRNVILGSKDIF